ncbi:group XIIB secretory phospholipase A2 isoform X1 [Labeo rohita]|uniref:Group XIIB secretory phospholipase A2 isoform X1 n=1 Tax=Labeo rohita TaxID=84645 RepID=A0A498NA54_LABRO|nr:group XIIB secretory phospholipase A2 isoform X1 [Labeo rohita]
MFPRALVLLLLCITAGLAATLIQASADAATVDSPADGSEAQAGETGNGESQADNILMADAPTEGKPATQSTTEESEDDSDWGLGSIRGGFQAVNGYFDSILELMGGRDGVCQYRCRYECKRILTDVVCRNCHCTFDMGVPAMTKCCNQLDICYDTCGSNKYRCDTKFRWCLHSICGDLKKSLGLIAKVEACEAFADTMYNTVWTLGCRPFMNGQRAACYCEGEEKDEL